jgi:glycolate oxidase iron-sulfur subunit
LDTRCTYGSQEKGADLIVEGLTVRAEKSTGEKLAWSPIGGFSPGGGPLIDDLARCVHCGLCLNACPTQRLTGLETESPRGRLYLMRAVREERIDITESFHQHMDLCLMCRACETACPSGVQFAKVMEATRADLWHKPVGPLSQRFALRLAFDVIFPHRRLFRLAFDGLRFYQRSGLQGLVRRSRLLERLPGGMAERERLMPDLSEPSFESDSAIPARIPGMPRVGFVEGCVMSTAFGDVQRASITVLEAFGAQVVTPPGQACCGALNVHAGEQKHAKAMARKLIESMLRSDVDWVVINSAGCGSVMKEYAELFADDPAYGPRVEEFAAKVRDFSELLIELPAWQNGEVRLRYPGTGVVAAYQDACHLRHAQKITRQPRRLLEAIEGMELVELHLPDQCCGSAGVYNLQHPDLSSRILGEKVDDITSTGAQVVVSANPGCILQIRSGMAKSGRDVPVLHIATVLHLALAGGSN